MTSDHVYLVGCARLTPVKIGLAVDPVRRLACLQTGSPVALKLLWHTQGGPALEGALHKRFAKYRIHGEWFDFRRLSALDLVASAAAEILADLEAVPRSARSRAASMSGAEMDRRTLDVLKGVSGLSMRAVARQLDVSPGSLARSLARLEQRGAARRDSSKPGTSGLWFSV